MVLQSRHEDSRDCSCSHLHGSNVQLSDCCASLRSDKFPRHLGIQATRRRKAGIIEFEDLECPACGQAASIVRAAMRQYKIPRVHHDFLIQSHSWSRAAAINARYIEDNLSFKQAEDYRQDVFGSQASITSRDDLQRFTARWFQSHNLHMPSAFDPLGLCAKEVEADWLMGLRVGVRHTPTIIIATADPWIEVTDPRQLFAAIDLAEASLKAVATKNLKNGGHLSSDPAPRTQGRRRAAPTP